MGLTKEIFVFGAGASNASAGAPLGQDLAWTYYGDTFTFPESINDKPTLEYLKQTSIEYKNLSKFFDLAEKVYPELVGEKKRWEETIKRSELVYYPPFDLDKKYYIDEMAKILQERGDMDGVELVRILLSEHIGEASRGMSNPLYKKFVTMLNGRNSMHTAIISLNFDCLLKEDYKNGVYFDYLINFHNIDKDRISYNKRNSIPLIKPNGSLDWAICPICKKITLRFPFITRTSYRDFSCPMGNGCRGKMKPFIFLPYERKNELVDALLDRAAKELKQANKITVIGYSFPDYDKDIINLFRENINASVPLEIIHYTEEKDTGKREEIKKKTKERLSSRPLIDKDNIDVSLDGFQEYITVMDDLTVSEIRAIDQTKR